MGNQIEQHNPGLAAVLSFLFNGLGQIYNGQLIKGMVIIFFSAVSMVLTVVGAVFLGYWLLQEAKDSLILLLGVGLFVSGIVCIGIIGICSILDAYRVAKQK